MNNRCAFVERSALIAYVCVKSHSCIKVPFLGMDAMETGQKPDQHVAGSVCLQRELSMGSLHQLPARLLCTSHLSTASHAVKAY